MGQKIGDAGYRIIEPIASGGMGDVYKAEHVITRRVEAIKVLSGAGTEEETDRFLREIQLQASLSHPNSGFHPGSHGAGSHCEGCRQKDAPDNRLRCPGFAAACSPASGKRCRRRRGW